MPGFFTLINIPDIYVKNETWRSQRLAFYRQLEQLEQLVALQEVQEEPLPPSTPRVAKEERSLSGLGELQAGQLKFAPVSPSWQSLSKRCPHRGQRNS